MRQARVCSLLDRKGARYAHHLRIEASYRARLSDLQGLVWKTFKMVEDMALNTWIAWVLTGWYTKV